MEAALAQTGCPSPDRPEPSVAARILALQDKLIEDRDQFRTLATRDWLTDVWTRPAFLDLLSRELNRCARQKSNLGSHSSTLITSKASTTRTVISSAISCSKK